MKKVIAIVLALVLLAGMLTGCGSKDSPVSSEGEASREVDIVLDWYPNAIHAFIYTAIERGYYEEEGLKVNVRFPSNVNDALSLVAAGKAEFGIYYPHDIIQTVANQGLPIKSIGSISQEALDIIASLSEKNINSPADFEGKIIGYAGSALGEAFAKSMMEAQGVDPSSVTLMDVGFDLMSSMTTGNVDATLGCMVNHEIPQMEEEGFDVSYFYYTDYGIPDYYAEVLLTNDALIEKEPETVSAFLRASKKGFDDFKADPDACLQIILDNQNEENFPLSPSVEAKSCEILLGAMEYDDSPFLSQTEECWMENIAWMFENGLIEKEISPSDVMVNIEY